MKNLIWGIILSVLGISSAIERIGGESLISLVINNKDVNVPIIWDILLIAALLIGGIALIAKYLKGKKA